ncbi:MAG TPA: hypothetical protein PKA56_02260 [Solirubrobacterales bacterium]|nr:hypothetical protein [Solirubrobacterales bacterium]HMU27842.1 hypothetical protein [Solirubrobacterales bacterium]HMX70559.1 hypothetical protein [Solirubrobacterales bacterium]HNA23217.1 hypothetical protein [Solirubrobacterales bacterium]HNC06886.1 hypothetical protein [Solirubrobacterales bacterium]
MTLVDGATLKDSAVRLYSSNVNDAVDVYGSGNVVDSTLTAYRGVYQMNSTGTVEIKRSALIPIDGGAVTEGGTMNIRDSVIINLNGGRGVFVDSYRGPAHVLIDGSTILGAPGSTGAEVHARRDQDDNPGTTSFKVNNSIIYGQDFAIVYHEYFAEDTLTVDVDSSAYDSSRVVEQPGAGTPQFTTKDPVELNGVDPMFADPDHGDYSPDAGSPLIDAGQAALPPVGSLAYDRHPRACDGNDDGTIRRDIGAWEYRSDPSDDCTYSKATINGPRGAATARSRSFTFKASKPGSTYLCSLDGAAFAACTTPYTASGLAVGNHSLKVKAKDSYGNVQTPPTEKSFKVEAADKTAPKVIGVKAPKQTRAATVKVSFKSNEKGSTFKCRLGKGKWKSCKSPWKTPKLRKGRNSISIQATDRAGNRSKVKTVAVKRK